MTTEQEKEHRRLRENARRCIYRLLKPMDNPALLSFPWEWDELEARIHDIIADFPDLKRYA